MRARDAWPAIVWVLVGSCAGLADDRAPVIQGVRLVSAEAASGVFASPEAALDGDASTEFRFEWANGGASVLCDLGGPRVLETLRVTNGRDDRLIWLREVLVGAEPEHLRPLLGRPVNLPVWRPADTADIPLPPSACRYVRVVFAGGPRNGAISELTFLGRPNHPERHLMCWAGDIARDFLDKLDYIADDLGATDLWLDYVETAFPQTNNNSGFQAWVDAGAFDALRRRGLRYWLSEHEAFTFMTRGPEDLRDDRRWETTLRRMRHVYARAKELGFRGIVYDAEDYNGQPEAVRERYKDVADFVDAWCYADEFGLAGMYYHRGVQVGRVIAEVWGCPLIQVYEARMYAGKSDCRAGNYWWLKGMHDAGVDVWIATERTYGAGEGEVDDPDLPAHLRRWFVRLPEYIVQVHAAYPFAARVLPGFHPWNTRLGKPCYLPRYLDEQLSQAEACALGCWIYNEGNRSAGDPRDVLDRAFCEARGIRPEDYLAVFARHPAGRVGG